MCVCLRVAVWLDLLDFFQQAMKNALVLMPPPVVSNDGCVKCDACGRWAKFTRCRVMSKLNGTWRCNECNVTCTQLRRLYGQWPSRDFSLIEKDFTVVHCGTAVCSLLWQVTLAAKPLSQ